MERGLAALDAAGIVHCVRNAEHRVRRPEPGKDVDVLVAADQTGPAVRTLRRSGLFELAAPGHGRHRFFVAFHDGIWLKLDLIARASSDGVFARREKVDGLWVAGQADRREHEELRARERATGSRRETFPQRLATGLRRRLPAGRRRLGIVVAVVGPDGAGKGTVIDRLRRELPVAVSVVYLGWRGRDAPPAGQPRPPRTGPPPSVVRETAFVARKSAVMWARVLRAYVRAWRGHVVLCDRHPSEMLITSERVHVVARVLERLLLSRLMPPADLVLLLTAPPSVLFARKPEHDLDTFEDLVAGYDERYGSTSTRVFTDGPIEAAVSAASRAVFGSLARRRGWSV